MRNLLLPFPMSDLLNSTNFLDERSGAPSSCVLASDPDASATPRHYFTDRPLGGDVDWAPTPKGPERLSETPRGAAVRKRCARLRCVGM